MMKNVKSVAMNLLVETGRKLRSVLFLCCGWQVIKSNIYLLPPVEVTYAGSRGSAPYAEHWWTGVVQGLGQEYSETGQEGPASVAGQGVDDFLISVYIELHGLFLRS